MAFVIPFIPYIVTTLVAIASGKSKIGGLVYKVATVFEKFRLVRAIKTASKEVVKRVNRRKIEAHLEWMEVLRTNSFAMIVLRLIGKLLASPFIVCFSLTKRFIYLFDLTLSPLEMKIRRVDSLVNGF